MERMDLERMESGKSMPHMSRQLIEFNHIYKELNDIYREAAVKVGLSLSGFDILYSICEMGDGCLQRDISQTCCIPKQTVNSSIRKLEQDGYLTLEKGKGRDMHIHLTEKGQKLMEEKIYPVIEAENHAFSSMSELECGKMLELYEKYNTALKEKIQELHIQGI